MLILDFALFHRRKLLITLRDHQDHFVFRGGSWSVSGKELEDQISSVEMLRRMTKKHTRTGYVEVFAIRKTTATTMSQSS